MKSLEPPEKGGFSLPEDTMGIKLAGPRSRMTANGQQNVE